MTDDDLTRLRELAEKATSGPWSAVTFDSGAWGVRTDAGWIASLFDPDTHVRVGEEIRGKENAKYIAALSPPVVISLLDRLERTCRWEPVEDGNEWESWFRTCDEQYEFDDPETYCPSCGGKVVRDE